MRILNMPESERDITREFLRSIMGGLADDDSKRVLNEQTSLPPIELDSIGDVIAPTEPAPADFEARVAAAFADHAEELGYVGIPDSEWRLEASRLKDSYDKKELTVETLDDLLGRIEIDYFDEFIEDIAEMYGVDNKGTARDIKTDKTEEELQNWAQRSYERDAEYDREKTKLSERDVTRDFLKKFY
jgi:hypothetical protein